MFVFVKIMRHTSRHIDVSTRTALCKESWETESWNISIHAQLLVVFFIRDFSKHYHADIDFEFNKY